MRLASSNHWDRSGYDAIPRLQAASDGKDDFVSHRIIIRHKPPNKYAWLDSQGISPMEVTIWGKATSAVFQSRYETVVLGSYYFGQFVLGQSTLLSQLAQPASRLFAP